MQIAVPTSTVLSGDYLYEITGRTVPDLALFRLLEGTDSGACQHGIESGPSLAVPISSGPLAQSALVGDYSGICSILAFNTPSEVA